jgi:hypothetical protein
MTYLNLYYRNGNEIIAHLTADKVEVYDKKLIRNLVVCGITIPRAWKKEFNDKLTIHLGDDDKLFAKAFLEEYFVHGLMQGGFHWKDQDGRDVVIWDREQRKIVGTIEMIFSKEITQISDKLTSMDINEEKSLE